MNRLLVQTQLSNYDARGKFILEADSGWQMVMGRLRVMLALDPTLEVDVMCPQYNQVITTPDIVNADLFKKYGIFGEKRLNFIPHVIKPNALATRYDFNIESEASALNLALHKRNPLARYTHVYINDPMLLRHFKAMFHIYAGYQPKFVVHSHFIDNPECPKFPVDASLWMGQVEAARRADYNFWQCESAMEIFFDSMAKEYKPDVVAAVRAKSSPWDDGYSSEEMNAPIDMKNVRFDPAELERMAQQQTIVFVPNRVGGEGRSSDYTNCGKFLFEHCNSLWAHRKDFIVLAGNPSQKFSNDEIAARCAPYVKLVSNAFNRDEYRLVAKHAHIAVGLYDQDSYGGTAARELIEMKCLPLWIDRYEYSLIAKATGYPYLAGDLSNVVKTLDGLIDVSSRARITDGGHDRRMTALVEHVRERCSYEATTPRAMKLAGLS